MTPFEAYKLFLALKMHFTTQSYDYFKYNGKVNATFHSFETRRDRYQYAKLAKHKDPQTFVVANFVHNPNFNGWIGDLFTQQSEDVYLATIAKLQSLYYHFNSQLNSIDPEHFYGMFQSKGGNYPQLLIDVQHGKISLETLVILENMLSFFDIWSKRISDPMIWPTLRNRCISYRPFLPTLDDRFKISVNTMLKEAKKSINTSVN